MTTRTRTRPALTAGLALLLAACGGTETRVEEGPRLPFHLMVLPVEINDLPGLPRTRGEDAPDEAEEVVLTLEEGQVTDALVTALDAGGFVEVTPLPYPEGVDRETFLGWEREEQDAWWIEAASDRQGDLILSSVITYHEGVRTDINDAFWLNLPLFLLGGPMTWYVNDRSYFLEARLSADVYAVSALEGGEFALARLGEDEARLQSARASLEEVPLDFIDRADGFGHYALSIIVPSGLLATESESVDEEIEEALLAELADGLRRDLQANSDDLVLARGMVDFFVRPDELRIEEAEGARWLVGDVYLEDRPDAPATMGQALLEVGGVEGEYFFDERERVEGESSRDRYWRYPFRFELPPGELPEHGRLVVVDGSRSEFRRTYLVPLGSPRP